ncbi:MAG: hypothetical protein KF723_17025 [Rhizobiaceae bacterium]|nr:hypothetical protein [Rhizobiaceae bacterium]
MAVSPRGTITIDASGSNGMDLDAFIRGGFLDAAGSEGGFPVFDNDPGTPPTVPPAFSGEEAFFNYGADTSTPSAADAYVTAHGPSLGYDFGTHTVSGEINTIEYGTRGSGSFDGNGYFSGGNVQLKITGLDLTDAEVHNFTAAHMAGTEYSATRIDDFADDLAGYSQVFIGSSGVDTYTGTAFDDIITGAGENDILDGGGGDDTAIFSGNFADYTITKNADGSITVVGADGTDTLRNIEQLQFDDQTSAAPVNDAPTGLTVSGSLLLNAVRTLFINETVAIGVDLGTLSATDPEGGTITYGLADDANGLFEVVGNKLRLKAGVDYETATAHQITLSATDEAGNVTTTNLSIQVRDVVEAPAGRLSIDASALGSGGVSWTAVATSYSFLSTYFAGSGNGTFTFYGGTADPAPYNFVNGPEIGFRWAGSDRQVLISGTDLAYDFGHYGSVYSHGISGTIDSITLGRYDGNTQPSTAAVPGVSGPGLLTGVIPGVTISGFDLTAAPGAGYQGGVNVVYNLYSALQTRNVATLQSLMASYAQDFKGTTGNDLFVGSQFDDTIDGNGGADFLAGGKGSDEYIVYTTDSIVVEQENEGVDTVKAFASFALGAHIENLQLQGTADIDATGNGLANLLTGNSGHNVLDGRGGADTMIGGGGNDTYIVDSAGDVVAEAANAGLDTVESSVSFVLGANVENIVLTGSAAINATGNALANDMTGNGAANVLDGGAGGDTMRGGTGNDTYVVDSVLDSVIELAGQGTDTVRSSLAATTLGLNVENLVLLGRAHLKGTGNTLKNVMTGNVGNNTLSGLGGNDTLSGLGGNDLLDGGLGNDTLNGGAGNDRLNGGLGVDRLTGGAGNDSFIFNVALRPAHRDLITDFNVGNDRALLERDVFTKVGPLGVLKAGAFALGARATEADDRIIYNKATGALFYDADGAGGRGQVQFATLLNKPVIDHTDFLVI